MSKHDRVRRPVPERTGPVRRPSRTFRGEPSGVVERAVSSAYEICEEMLRQGRQAATRFRPEDRMSRPYPPPPRFPGEYAFQMWQDWMRMWAGFMNPYMPGAQPFAPWAWNQGGHDPAGEQVELDISSPVPVRVTVDLHDRHAHHSLDVEPLEVRDTRSVPAIRGARVECRDVRMRVSLTVPADQPPGTYAGAILRDRRPVGHLYVEVRER